MINNNNSRDCNRTNIDAKLIHFPSLTCYFILHFFSSTSQTMELQTLIAAFIAFIVLFANNVTASTDPLNTPALCEPGVVDEMPQHIKKVCYALENSNQLSSALNAYIRTEAAGMSSAFEYHIFSIFIIIFVQSLALHYRPDDFIPSPGPTGKRTDVDHVFLRFGRRR